MSKALEAAAKAIRQQGGFTDDKYEHGWSKGYARAAISAYLSALAEDEETVERVARAIAPRCWDVMDAELRRMLARYKGQEIAYPSDQFQHKESMNTARAALRALKETKP